MFNRQQ